MDGKLVKENYRMLRTNLYLIKNKLSELEGMYDDLLLNTKENFLVDDKVIYSDCFLKIGIDCKCVRDELMNELIPSVKENLND